jgi:flavin reductase (DIM6/NTAB) family NADH-FMN oxidoreductase RutF
MEMTGMIPHAEIDPAIFYLGTPVVLISTLNEDGTANLAPMSSAWWLGWGCMLGLRANAKTVENLRRHGECVLNVASVRLASAVDRIALTTGSDPVPANMAALGFHHVKDKFGHAGLTPVASALVSPPRVGECQLCLEASVETIHPFGASNPRMRTPMAAIEVRILRAHADPAIMMRDDPNRIDPDAWHPLIMSFRQFYTTAERVHPSRLADGFPEALYRGRPGAR